MKKNKTFLIIIFILIIFIISGYFISKNKKINTNSNLENDYTPEEEISEEQMRNTIVSLYFLDSANNCLKTEGRVIDSASLLTNPYQTLVNLLIEGPKNSDLTKLIPDNTTLINASIDHSNVILNFSSEILNFADETQKYNIINSILNTLSQLNEVNSFNILINNEVSEQYPDTYSVIH